MGIEPKKLALVRICQILRESSDYDHPMTQEKIRECLDERYGIQLERKAIGRNLLLLNEAGIGLDSDSRGTWLTDRPFTDSELRLLVDCVLASKHICVPHSKELIQRLSELTSAHARKRVLRHSCTVSDWDKTDSRTLFYHMELIEDAVGTGKMIEYNYNKYGIDKHLHKSAFFRVSPYQLILHNQHYYLMGYNEIWGQRVEYHRLDRITNMVKTDRDATPIRSVPGYENGIDYKRFSTAMPYMYADAPERISFYLENEKVIDQVIDWFGKDILISREPFGRCLVTVTSSPSAMVYWALQYTKSVTVVSPAKVRDEILSILNGAAARYGKTE